MSFRDPPKYAAWQHRDARDGFEVVFLHSADDGYRLEGGTAAVEGGEAWVVRYAIVLDSGWFTGSALISGRSGSGAHELMVEADGAGHWRINGVAASHLDGCLDVDLESSSLTNAFPVHRLGLEIGQQADAPAAYVRAVDLSVERLEQHYVRLEDDGSRERYHYTAPGFGFECQLSYDEFGLVLDYPGIAVRTA
jgi:hypothetical protein